MDLRRYDVLAQRPFAMRCPVAAKLALAMNRPLHPRAGPRKCARSDLSGAVAQAPDAVVHTVAKLIDPQETRFGNPIGKMSGINVFLQSCSPRMFEGFIPGNVQAACA